MPDETSHHPLALPISKPWRVRFELVRTVAAVLAVMLNGLILLRVFDLV